MKPGKLSTSLIVMCLSLVLSLFAQGWEDVPEDYDGVLIKTDITTTTRTDDLEISVTAMDESIITYATLELKEYFRNLIKENTGNGLSMDPTDPKGPVPFLVNFRAMGQEVRYEPHELVIYCHGMEYKPLQIIPISPKFMDKVAYIRQPPVAAIYLFDRSIDLQSQDLIFSYFDSLRFGNWLKVIERLNAAKTQYQLDSGRK